ncbi:hypothetical protein B1694_04225 [Geobacillus zalihae]|nr:hypothetical protein I656_01825 [Geobacillus sp. WSUCF1]OQP18171.1 hypothetical protein B1693_00535 [Geobacillus zalihae]OQP24442.1 hypothetical protein B1694_04225 [Geobacillus zalihae]
MSLILLVLLCFSIFLLIYSCGDRRRTIHRNDGGCIKWNHADVENHRESKERSLETIVKKNGRNDGNG